MSASTGGPEGTRRVSVFAPNPLLTVTIEARGTDGDEIHFHPGGQGVWLMRMAGELGAEPVLCGFGGGEAGAVLVPLLEKLTGEVRLVRSASDSGCYVVDRRSGERVAVAQRLSEPASRHEVDDLFAATCTAALESAVLAVCNPYPEDALPLEVYSNLVTDVRANGVPVIVDLSTPRLDAALAGSPNLVKLNDWELAEFADARVDGVDRLRAAAEPILAAGVETVVVTRGAEPAYVLRGEEVWELITPRMERGSREGCGDTMMGAIAAAWAAEEPWQEALRLGAAAGATNFLRHGLGTGSRATVEKLLGKVELRPISMSDSYSRTHG
jgi:1-phosphofructokinase